MLTGSRESVKKSLEALHNTEADDDESGQIIKQKRKRISLRQKRGSNTWPLRSHTDTLPLCYRLFLLSSDDDAEVVKSKAGRKKRKAQEEAEDDTDEDDLVSTQALTQPIAAELTAAVNVAASISNSRKAGLSKPQKKISKK